MKALLTLAFSLALAVILTAPAFATGKDPKPTPQPPGSLTHSSATSSSSSSSSSGPIDLSMMANPIASGGSTSSGNTYVFPAPAAATPLPSGLCPKGDSQAWSVIWGFVSWSRSSMRTEHECLDKLLQYGRDTAPKAPAPAMINYLSGLPNPPPACLDKPPVDKPKAKQSAAPGKC